MSSGGGRCDFDDGGSYIGTWHEGTSHGHGVCTGPMGQGEYAGSWQYGFEVSGVYTWTSGNYYEGHWLQGKRHGIGVERKGRWLYRGEWTQGFKGRYGIRQSTATGLKFEGTWTSGLQDGYGVETYADGGTYQGQWLRGLRHGYGVRQSVSYDLASRYLTGALPSSSAAVALPGGGGGVTVPGDDEAALIDRDRRTEDSRGGFVLLARTTPSTDDANRNKKRLLLDKHGRPSLRKTIANELRLIRQKSTGDIQEGGYVGGGGSQHQHQQQQQPPRSSSRQSGGSVRSTVSAMSQSSAISGWTTASSVYSDDAGSFVSQTDLEQGENVVERYLGEWKSDKRSGFGICERSDGIKYEGEWFNNKKYGYGVTTLRDGSRLEGKYKNNVLVSSGRSSKLFILRTTKVRDRVESAVLSAHKAAEFAKQKADIANARMTSARVKSDQAEEAAKTAFADAELARAKAREYSPNNTRQPGEKIITNRLQQEDLSAEFADYEGNPSDPHQQHQHQYGGQVPPQSPKKFSFFKFKKDGAGSLRGTIPRSTTAAEAHPPLSQTFFHQQTSAFPAANSSSAHAALPSLQIASHNPLPPISTSTGVGGLGLQTANDFRAPQHRTQLDGTRHQVSLDRPQVGNAPVESQWNQGHHLTGFTQGPVTSPSFQAFHSGEISPGMHPVPGFEESYNWMGYGETRERRKSLPSIVKDKKDVNPKTTTTTTAAANRLQSPTTTTLSPQSQQVDTYVIEDGVRKRVRPLYADFPVQKAQSLLDKDKPRLPKKLYELEAPNRYRQGEKGSMPDVTAITDADVMPREAVYVMSQQRREQLMRERADEERRRRNQIVFRLGDLKDWCQRRQVLVVVLALNISLATVFYSMLH